MTSALVLLIASVLHFGLRGSCFLSIERFPVVPGTVYAGHIAYCAILHFLHDMEILPSRYRNRMGWLAAFLVELVLGVAVMEVLALWLWCSVEHIAHMTIQFVLRRYGGMSIEFYQQWEAAIMGGVMTSLAALLWLNAYDATEPSGAAANAAPAASPTPSPRSKGTAAAASSVAVTAAAAATLKAKPKKRPQAKEVQRLSMGQEQELQQEEVETKDPDENVQDPWDLEELKDPEASQDDEEELELVQEQEAEHQDLDQNGAVKLRGPELRVFKDPELQTEFEHGSTTEC